jgi:phi13 family phage major tail protein
MSKFTLSRGLSNIMYAEITKDDSGAYTAGEPKQLIPAGNLTIAVDSSTNDTYFDNSLFYRAGQEGNSTVTIDGAMLRPEMIADLTGKEVDTTTGAIVDDGTYHEKYFAVGGRIGLVDGTFINVWYLKGTFGYPQESAKTEDGSTDVGTMTLTFSAVKTVYTFGKEKGCKRVIMDSEVSEVVAEGDFFKQVVTPENLSTVIKKKTA